MFLCLSSQVDEVDLVETQPLLMGEDFKAFSKIRVENHHYNKYAAHFSPHSSSPLANFYLLAQ